MFIDAEIDDLILFTSQLIKWAGPDQYFFLQSDNEDSQYKVSILSDKKPLFHIENINPSKPNAAWQNLCLALENENLNYAPPTSEKISIPLPLEPSQNDALKGLLKNFYQAAHINKIKPATAHTLFMFPNEKARAAYMMLGYTIIAAYIIFIIYELWTGSLASSFRASNISVTELFILSLMFALACVKTWLETFHMHPLAKKRGERIIRERSNYSKTIEFFFAMLPVFIALRTLN